MLVPTVGNHEVGSKPDLSRERLFGEMFTDFNTDGQLAGIIVQSIMSIMEKSALSC